MFGFRKIYEKMWRKENKKKKESETYKLKSF